MGIHNFDENDKLVFKDGQTLSTKLSDPAQVLQDIDQVRDTFVADSASSRDTNKLPKDTNMSASERKSTKMSITNNRTKTQPI